MEAVRNTLRLHYPQEDGTSLYDKYQQVEETTGEEVPDQEIDIPDELSYLFDYFWDIRGGVPSGGFGANRIPWTELESWMRIRKTPLFPWEITLISKMDATYMDFIESKQKEKRGRK